MEEGGPRRDEEGSETRNGGEPEAEAASGNGDAPERDEPTDSEADSSNGPIDEAVKSSESENVTSTTTSKIRNGEGSRTFTMREILNELKEGDVGSIEESPGSVLANGDGRRANVAFSEGNKRDVGSYSSDGLQQQYVVQSENTMDLINNVTGVDEEGRSRQRILAFAARRYASAIERNPEDYDAYYNWALVLQESADNVIPDSSSSSKDALLEEACKKYDEATRLCPTLHDAFYNWAIAISDRAKMRGRTKDAEELWKQATRNYEKAVQLNWNSPQALNNWGLALQELSAIVPMREKQTIVRSAISKFRSAIRLQFDFHRAIYNLGTVLYGLAEDTLRSGRPVNTKEVSPNDLYSQSAVYIAAAHALKPNYSVYRSALRLVRSMLPLPYLKVGYLTAPPAKNLIAPHSDWERSQFVLNHEGLQQVSGAERDASQSPVSIRRASSTLDLNLVKVNVLDIVSVSACADLTLPPGAGLCIDTTKGPVYLVADTWDALDGWLDAIRLVYVVFAREKSDILAGIITS